MVRIRSIKPEFFADSKLGAISPRHRLLFARLWCHADHEGRQKDNSKELKVKILPYDRCNVDKMLNDLQLKGMITRYNVSESELKVSSNGVPGESQNANMHLELTFGDFIQILNFSKHQCPNVKEPQSIIPAQCHHVSLGKEKNEVQLVEEAPEPTSPASSPPFKFFRLPPESIEEAW